MVAEIEANISVQSPVVRPAITHITHDRVYITTAIDYPNALPHVGTAFEKIGADVQARFHRFVGRKVFFLMGNDENTAKIIKAARERFPGEDLTYDKYLQYVNETAAKFKEIWARLDLSFDDFIQTSERRHQIGVQKFLQTVYDAGYIYKKPFKGLYCQGCEEFKTSKSLVNGKCPNHPNDEVHEAEEENYFFKLSAFKQKVLDLLGTEINVLPECRMNEMKAFIENELEDISISRVNQGWGILCPFDASQVVYVWFDALLNYLTGVGFGTNNEKFKYWWPAYVHFIGKDITRFHCVLWPAMIAAYNEKAEEKIAYPKSVFAHGFIYRRPDPSKKEDSAKVKEGKSTGGLNPSMLIDLLGSDGFRYYFMAKCPYGGDGEYDIEHMKEVYNADLANNLGNVLSRVATLAIQHFDCQVPAVRPSARKTWMTGTQGMLWLTYVSTADYRDALRITWDVLRKVNEYIEQQKPWAQAKTDKAACGNTLGNVIAALRLVAIMLMPFLPKAAKSVYETFEFKGKWESIDQYQYLPIVENHHLALEEGIALNRGRLINENGKLKCPPLFPRI